MTRKVGWARVGLGASVDESPSLQVKGEGRGEGEGGGGGETREDGYSFSLQKWAKNTNRIHTYMNKSAKPSC